jgi:cytochrome b
MFQVRIWDLPTRLFHWGLVLCVSGLVITGNIGGNAMQWHFRLGYCVLTLLLFRVLWGFVGGYWSRWSHLPISPTHVWAYLQGRDRFTQFAGHNPLGSWSVVSFLLIFFLQVGTGLISDDEIANMGPLSSLASGQWVALATSWHKGWGQWLLWTVIGLHLAAIVFYSVVRCDKLVPAMLHGDKVGLPADLPASRDGLASWASALLFAAACAVMAYWVWTRAAF